MWELRPLLGTHAEFAGRVDAIQRKAGYRLAGGFESAPDAVVVAGFRNGDGLSWGDHLYIDDLSAVPEARGRGHARRLLDWVHEEAVRLGCHQVHLDSGVGSDRWDAHRLYLNAGYHLWAHHFPRQL